MRGLCADGNAWKVLFSLDYSQQLLASHAVVPFHLAVVCNHPLTSWVLLGQHRSDPHIASVRVQDKGLLGIGKG